MKHSITYGQLERLAELRRFNPELTMKPKPKPYRKPGGPSETLDKLRKGKSILVDRITANRLRATASQRAIPYKSCAEGDMVRITKL